MIDFRELFADRYPKFADRHKLVTVFIGHFLALLFHQHRFQQFEKEYPHFVGLEFVQAALDFFDFRLHLDESELERIPTLGRVVIVSNHPIGSLDGIALLNLIGQKRSDIKAVVNETLLKIEPLHSISLPVNNMGGKTTIPDLRALRKHLDNEGALLIFPAGEVSRFRLNGVRDRAWNNGFVKIAKATKAPILPIFIRGRNSLFFYVLSLLMKPLSTAWLIREMFKQSHKTICVRVGHAVPHNIYSANQLSAPQLAGIFKNHVYHLSQNCSPVFKPIEMVALPESKALMKREALKCETLSITPDGKKILLTTMEKSPCIMREIGRLREMTFRVVGEGSGFTRDIDQFDKTYYQLVLWDEHDLEIVGAYRLGDAKTLIKKRGLMALYTNTLFDFDKTMSPYFDRGLELGRSFVQPKYQNHHALDYLWLGIGAFVKRNPRFRYLFGAASISNQYGKVAIEQIIYFYVTHYSKVALGVKPKTPYIVDKSTVAKLATEFHGTDASTDFKSLRNALRKAGLSIPTLFKHYSYATEPDGTVFAAFNVDKNFGSCVDAFVMADLNRLKPQKRRRYLEEIITR